MLLTTHLQSLAVYFRHSTLFYYFTTDLKGHFTYVNGLFQERFSWVADDFYSLSASSVINEEDIDTYKKIARQCLEQPGTKICTELKIGSSGTAVSKIIWEFSAVTDDNGEPESIQAIGVPVDEKAALIESERVTRHQAIILNNVSDTIVTTDMNRRITSWNKVTEKLTGIPEEKALGRIPREIIDNDYFPYTHDQVAEIVFRDGIWRGEMSLTGADGERKYFLHTISLLFNEKGEKIGLLSVGKDITARKEAEEKLLESELFYRNMIAYSLDGIVMTGMDATIIYCAPSVSIVTGHRPEQLIGQKVFDFVHPDDVETAKDAFWKEFNKSSDLSYVLIRLKHVEGHWVSCTVRGHNLLDNPAVKAYVIYFTDDTKRKEAEDKLKESEHRFREMIYNLNQGVLMLNNKREVIGCNYTAQSILGLREEQTIGKIYPNPKWSIFQEDGSEFKLDQYPSRRALATKKPVRNVVMGIQTKPEFDRVWLIINADPTLDADGNVLYIVLSFSEITTQRKLSQQLIDQEIQKQKLLTQATIDGQEKERQEIGKELHDNINQHLTTTRLYLEVAKEHATGPVLEMIQQSHKMLVGIINEIRSMSQSLVPPTLGDIGLVESIQDLCDSLKRAHTFSTDFFHRHFYEERLPANMKLMLFRIIQEQVSNIIRHAQAEHVYIKLQSDAENIILTIIDNGKGFDPNHYKKGLGFSNMFNRASLFNGKMDLEAAPGKGCKLTISIPLEAYEQETETMEK